MEPEPGRAPQCVVSGYTDRLNNDSKILAKAHIIPRELCLTPSDVYDENNQWWLTANLHHAFDGCRWKVDSNGEIFTSFTDKERKQLGLTQSHVNPVVLTLSRLSSRRQPAKMEQWAPQLRSTTPRRAEAR